METRICMSPRPEGRRHCIARYIGAIEFAGVETQKTRLYESVANAVNYNVTASCYIGSLDQKDVA